jgi:hypothetical protein
MFPILQNLCEEAKGRTYVFMEPEEYRELCEQDLRKAQQTYWLEMLRRAHWVVGTGMLRHERWLDATLAAAGRANLLGFAACLRGMLESAADLCHSLCKVPLTLAHRFSVIKLAIQGKSDVIHASKELEDILIHFHYARRMPKKAPESYQAHTNREYLKSLSGGETGVLDLYSKLCEFTHPAAVSALWLSGIDEGIVSAEVPDEHGLIVTLCDAHKAGIEPVIREPLLRSLVTMRTINLFGVPDLHSASVERYDLQYLPTWRKVCAAVGVMDGSVESKEPTVSEAPRMATTTGGVGRNDPCPCGSGKKFKKCCLHREAAP